jgi:methionyl-tRNA formyltransferase
VTSLPIQRLLVVGDTYGVPEVLARVPSGCVVGIIAAEIRPQYYEELKKLADGIGVPLLVQPRVNSPNYCDFLSCLTKLSPDTLISHSYSMLIRGDVLSLVSGRAFNVHMALLPRNRGPNPIQWALIHGDQMSGVTLHMMDEGFDCGDIVDQESLYILNIDTWLTLFSRLKMAATILLDRAMPSLLNGDWQAVEQDERAALHNARIQPESFEINFSTMSDLQIYNIIRAQVAPLKGAYLDTPSGRVRFTEYLPLETIAGMRKQYG